MTDQTDSTWNCEAYGPEAAASQHPVLPSRAPCTSGSAPTRPSAARP